MGRIKSTMIKKASRQLLEGENRFTSKFEDNKKVLRNDTMPSKPLRNKIAGYIARIIKMKEMSVEREARRKKSQALKEEAEKQYEM